jgi:hypothetical protein
MSETLRYTAKRYDTIIQYERQAYIGEALRYNNILLWLDVALKTRILVENTVFSIHLNNSSLVEPKVTSTSMNG